MATLYAEYPHIKIAGVGGGGNNAVSHMINSGLEGVEFIALDTDAAALGASPASKKVQLGEKLTKGLGTEGNTEIGEKAALEERDRIIETLRGAELVFIIAGMGGGTGGGASPIVAECAKEIGAFTIGVVTTPFNFEEKIKHSQAERSILNLKEKADALLTIPGEKILKVFGKNPSRLEPFSMADDILRHIVQSISAPLVLPALISFDFQDVKTIMSNEGTLLIGIGVGQGDNCCVTAAKAALRSPLLEGSLKGAGGILVNYIGDNDSFFDIINTANIIEKETNPHMISSFSALIDESFSDKAIVTFIAAGME